MRPAAIFDVDGTLIRGTSAERLLVPWLVRQRVIGARQLAAAAALAAAYPLVGRTRALRANKRWVSGVAVRDVLSRMDTFLDEVVAPRWHEPVLSRLEALRAQGIAPFLLSGAPDFIVEAVGERLGVEGTVSTAMEIRDGRFTGRLLGPHRFASAKRAALASLALDQDLDLEASWAFADHLSDVAFLEGVGHPVAVSPGRRLRGLAAERGWEVIG